MARKPSTPAATTPRMGTPPILKAFSATLAASKPVKARKAIVLVMPPGRVNWPGRRRKGDGRPVRLTGARDAIYRSSLRLVAVIIVAAVANTRRSGVEFGYAPAQAIGRRQPRYSEVEFTGPYSVCFDDDQNGFNASCQQYCVREAHDRRPVDNDDIMLTGELIDHLLEMICRKQRNRVSAGKACSNNAEAALVVLFDRLLGLRGAR